MCTSIALMTDSFYFGRNLDLEYRFGERVVVTPRNYPVRFRRAGRMDRHYALIGMAAGEESFPLYAEAANEKGLCIAGLNFPGYAYYPEEEDVNRVSVSPFELPLWLLGQCDSVREARQLLHRTQVVSISFSEALPLTPLHWHIADKAESIVLECMRQGMVLHDNPAGVLTNSPPFDFHMNNLRQYLNLTTGYPENRFSQEIDLTPFGVGMGGIGLPGDYSPASRFVRAAFIRLNSVGASDENADVSRFFHLLDAVAMPDGIVMTDKGEYEKTAYSSCIRADSGVFFYKTYTNSRLTAVDMYRENLDGRELIAHVLRREQDIYRQN